MSATDNKELNDKISKLCMSKNILVNNITSQDNMNLRFMSILSMMIFKFQLQLMEILKKL